MGQVGKRRGRLALRSLGSHRRDRRRTEKCVLARQGSDSVRARRASHKRRWDLAGLDTGWVT